jgi:hypothetical protein
VTAQENDVTTDAIRGSNAALLLGLGSWPITPEPGCRRPRPSRWPLATRVAGTGTGSIRTCARRSSTGSELVTLHAAHTNLVSIPERVDFPVPRAWDLRFATAYRAPVGRDGVTDGEWVTVVGAGRLDTVPS